MGVGQPGATLLNRYGILIREAFDLMPYHVGSSVLLKTGWRDVDVRVIYDDERFAAEFPGLDPDRTQLDPKCRAICLVWSVFGQQYTGLPIDFQIQQLTYANEHHDGPRSAIGIIHKKDE